MPEYWTYAKIYAEGEDMVDAVEKFSRFQSALPEGIQIFDSGEWDYTEDE